MGATFAAPPAVCGSNPAACAACARTIRWSAQHSKDASQYRTRGRRPPRLSWGGHRGQPPPACLPPTHREALRRRAPVGLQTGDRRRRQPREVHGEREHLRATVSPARARGGLPPPLLLPSSHSTGVGDVGGTRRRRRAGARVLAERPGQSLDRAVPAKRGELEPPAPQQPRHPLAAERAVPGGRQLRGRPPCNKKLYRVGPNCETWPKTLTENPY